MRPEGMNKYLNSKTNNKEWIPPKSVTLADTRVRIETVLGALGVEVPAHAGSWKVFCPMGMEHSDGGAKRAMRVYSDTNSCMCFSLHGGMTPSRLWSQYYGMPMVAAAEELCKIYELEEVREPYWERMRKLQQSKSPVLDRRTLLEVYTQTLRSSKAYLKNQFGQMALDMVQWLQDEINALPDDIDFRTLETWHKEKLRKVQIFIEYLENK